MSSGMELGFPLEEQYVRPDASDIFDRLYRAYVKAGERSALKIERYYRLAGRTLKLCFAGDALVSKLTPALSPLICNPIEKPDVEICIWDSRTTGLPLPSPDWTPQDYLARGEIRGLNRGKILASYQTGPDILNMFNRERNRGLFWIRDARRVPFYECAAPLRIILHWWLRSLGRQLIHGGAFGTDSGGVLLAGSGGAGKSTASLALGMSRGMGFAGDDYCVLEPGPPPWIHSLYATAKLDGASIKRLVHLNLPVNTSRTDGEKTVIYLHERFAARLIPGFPLKAILCPRITGSARTTVRPESSGAGYRALAVSSVFQLPGADPSDLNRIASTMRCVPAFILEMGTDMIEAAQEVRVWSSELVAEAG